MSDPVCVFTSSSPTHAELLGGALRSLGFEVHVLTSTAAGERVPESRIMVRGVDAVEAREAIEELERQQ